MTGRIVALHVRTGAVLHIRQQARGNRQCREQMAIRGIQKFSIARGAPVFRNEIIDAGGADGHGPPNTGGDEALGMGGLPQCRHPNLCRVPIPCLVVAVIGIELHIRENAVLRRLNAGDQRRVARVGHRGPHADHAVGIGSIGHEAVEKRHLGARAPSPAARTRASCRRSKSSVPALRLPTRRPTATARLARL